MNIVFFGSSDFVVPVLASLHENGHVVTIVTTPDTIVGRKKDLTPTPVAQAATQFSMRLFKFPSLKTPDVHASLTELGADCFVVASYGKIIPQAILDIPPLGAINIHPSLLPLYRGPTPIQTALRNGDTQTGVSIIRMDAEVDHGPLLAQTTTDIEPRETFRTLAPRLFTLSIPLLQTTLEQAQQHTLNPQEQDHTHATFTTIITKADGQIQWQHPAQTIYNQFRAFDPWPGIWTNWDGQILKIIECSVSDQHATTPPGTVSGTGTVSCGNNTTLTLTRVQLAGKQPTDIKSFLRGYPTFRGSVLQ